MAEKEDRTGSSRYLASNSGFVHNFPTDVEEPAAAAGLSKLESVERTAGSSAVGTAAARDSLALQRMVGETRVSSLLQRVIAGATASALSCLATGAPTTEIAATASIATTAEVVSFAADCLAEAESLAIPLAVSCVPLTSEFFKIIIASLEVLVRHMEFLAADQELKLRDLGSDEPESVRFSAPTTESMGLPQRFEIGRKRTIAGCSNERVSQAKRMKFVIRPKESGTVKESLVTEDSSATPSPPEAPAKSSATEDSSPELILPKASFDKPSFKD